MLNTIKKLKHLTKAVRLGWKFIKKIEEGKKQRRLKKYEQALDCFSNASEIFGDFEFKTKNKVLSEAYFLKAHLLKTVYLDYDSSKSNLEIALKLYSDYDYALNLMGNVLIKYGEFENAKKYLLKAKAVNVNFIAPDFNFAEISFLERDFKKALDIYEQILLRENNNPEAMLEMAICHYQLGNESKSFELYITVLGLAKKHLPPKANFFVFIIGYERFKKRFVISNIGSIKEKSQFKSCIKLLLNSDEMRNTSIRGGNFLRKDNLEEAKEQFRQLLELELKSGLVHFCLGLIAQKQNQIREANQHFSKAENLGYEKAREFLNHNSEAKFYNSLMQFCELT